MFLSKSFHNMIDADARAHQLYVQNAGWTAFPTYISFERINLNYQFFPHFHPYVAVNRAAVPMMKLSLLERLKEGGLPELEDSDTLYMPQPNPPPGQPKQALVVIPNSTRASLSASIAALRPSDNSTLALTAGTPLTLADNTLVTVPKGTLCSDSPPMPAAPIFSCRTAAVNCFTRGYYEPLLRGARPIISCS